MLPEPFKCCLENYIQVSQILSGHYDYEGLIESTAAEMVILPWHFKGILLLCPEFYLINIYQRYVHQIWYRVPKASILEPLQILKL